MRVFLFISKQGDGWPLCMRITEEGHRGVIYINDDAARRVGNGMVEKHPVQSQLIDDKGNIDEGVLKQVLYPKPDCIVFDMVGWGYGKLADRLRKEGYPVVGASAWGDQIELDRPYGNKVMKIAGIGTPRNHVFKDYPSAIRFVEDTNKPYVYKPSGNQPTTTTYVARTPDDLIGMLEFYSDIKEEFELQEIVKGIEISTEIWFNGKDVVNVNHTMEEKALMEGGIGPKTGCMGAVVWQGHTACRLYKEGIGKLVPALRKVDYRGPIDLNTIVTEDKLYALEFTPRFGYDAIFALREGYLGKVNDWLYGVASGVTKGLRFKPGFGIGVSFVVEPYPMADVKEDYSKDILIQGISNQNLKHLWPYDMYKKGNSYACAGVGGNIGVVSAQGDSVREARRRAYRTLSNLIIPDVMYRRDIGQHVDNDIIQLRVWKWID